MAAAAMGGRPCRPRVPLCECRPRSGTSARTSPCSEMYSSKPRGARISPCSEMYSSKTGGSCGCDTAGAKRGEQDNDRRMESRRAAVHDRRGQSSPRIDGIRAHSTQGSSDLEDCWGDHPRLTCRHASEVLLVSVARVPGIRERREKWPCAPPLSCRSQPARRTPPCSSPCRNVS